MAVERRLAFGQVAELYDRARPSYPATLVDDVVRFARAEPGDWAAEVGAGTGKATVLFAERGLRIVALEPSAEMAGIAERNTARFPEVQVARVEFERWVPERPFRLLFSGQAWHWMTPEVRYLRAAQALGEGGVLAVFWNGVNWENSPLRDDLDAVYQRHVPAIMRPSGPMRPTSEAPKDWLDWDAELRQAGGFGQPMRREYEWVHRYSADEYLGVLQTHSDHVVLPPKRRRALLAEIGRVIGRAGGFIEIDYVTRLAMARRAFLDPGGGIGLGTV